MAKTVKIIKFLSHATQPCDQCGKPASSGVELKGTGLLGISEGFFCGSGCAAAYARDHGWTLK